MKEKTFSFQLNETPITILTEDEEEILREFFRQERADRYYFSRPEFSFFAQANKKLENPVDYVISVKSYSPQMGEIYENLYMSIVNYAKQISFETRISPIDIVKDLEGRNEIIRRILPERNQYESISDLQGRSRMETLDRTLKDGVKGLPSLKTMKSLLDAEGEYIQSRANIIYGTN